MGLSRLRETPLRANLARIHEPYPNMRSLRVSPPVESRRYRDHLPPSLQSDGMARYSHPMCEWEGGGSR
jgi:hypothetical protein